MKPKGIRRAYGLRLCLVALAVILAACGPDGRGMEEPATIHGGAGGSVFAGADVVVRDYATGEEVGSGTTTEAGHYEIAHIPHGGPYRVELSGGVEKRAALGGGETRLAMKTSVFGIVPHAEGKTLCQISPLSQLAYWIARGRCPDGQLTRQAMDYAVALVAGTTGVDVLVDHPVGEAEMDDDAIIAVALTKAGIRQLERAVRDVAGEAAAPAHMRFTCMVAMLGQDMADGVADGHVDPLVWDAVAHDLRMTPEDAQWYEAELAPLSAAMAQSFRARMVDLGGEGYAEVAAKVLDDIDAENPGLLSLERKAALRERLMADGGSDVDLNPVVALHAAFAGGVTQWNLALEDGPYARRAMTCLLQRADESTEAIADGARITAEVEGPMADALRVEQVQGGECAVVCDWSGMDCVPGRNDVTITARLEDGRELRCQLAVNLRRGATLTELRLGGFVWDDAGRFAGGLDLAAGQLGYDSTDAFGHDLYSSQPLPMRVDCLFAGGASAGLEEVVLSVDRGRLYNPQTETWETERRIVCEGGDETIWALCTYRTPPPPWDGTQVILRAQSASAPSVAAERRFTLWRDGRALAQVWPDMSGLEVTCHNGSFVTIRVPLEGRCANGEDARSLLLDGSFLLGGEFAASLENELGSYVTSAAVRPAVNEGAQEPVPELVMEYTGLVYLPANSPELTENLTWEAYPGKPDPVWELVIPVPFLRIYNAIKAANSCAVFASCPESMGEGASGGLCRHRKSAPQQGWRAGAKKGEKGTSPNTT